MSKRWMGALALAALGLARPAAAQTDYYNTDAGRPIRVEDALPVERHALELQLAPVRLERGHGGVYRWEVAPELSYGVLPRTQVEVAFPFAWTDTPDQARGLAGIEVSALHNLNTETRTLPALAVAASAVLPAGPLRAARTYATLKGIATRTFPGFRVHANGAYTLGADPRDGERTGEAPRWMAGVAVDRAFPIRALLATADVLAEEPLGGGGTAWTAEAGVRLQTSPQFNLDAGIGRRFAGPGQGWALTLGASHTLGVRSLIPGL